MGFKPMTSANTGAMLYQLNCEATHWEPGHFCGFYLSHEGIYDRINEIIFAQNNFIYSVIEIL